jgi:hypothetical protein
LIVPVARYAYPQIIPTMLIIDIGWLEIAKLANDYLMILLKLSFAHYIVFFVD